MIKRYSDLSPTVKESKKGPSKECLNAILNYSKSTEVKHSKRHSLVINLN